MTGCIQESDDTITFQMCLRAQGTRGSQETICSACVSMFPPSNPVWNHAATPPSLPSLGYGINLVTCCDSTPEVCSLGQIKPQQKIPSHFLSPMVEHSCKKASNPSPSARASSCYLLPFLLLLKTLSTPSKGAELYNNRC